MHIVRICVDQDGLSHFVDVEVPFSLVEYAPPAPPLHVTELTTATSTIFVSFPVGWNGDWHTAPRRQLMVFLAGEIAAETGDGEKRCFGQGSAVLVEDTTGSGHRSWVVGGADVVAVVVHLPE